jgi:hypothetical protein
MLATATARTMNGRRPGGDPHVLNDPHVPAPPPGCGEPICLVDCKVTMHPGFSKSIKPPPSPAVVSSLFDILGLDKTVVHADDLLLALLVISGMLSSASAWNGYHEGMGSPLCVLLWPSACLWGPWRMSANGKRLEWGGPPVRMTWTLDSASS